MNGINNENITHGDLELITNLKFRYYQNTQRLENHIKYLIKENEKLKKEIDDLENMILEPNEYERNDEPALDLDEEDYRKEWETENT